MAKDEDENTTTRDYKRYVYLTVRIPRDGWVHQQLQADAEESGLMKLHGLAATRLKDYYLLRAQGIAPIGAPQTDKTNNAMDADEFNAEANADEANKFNAEANADEANKFW